MMILTLPIVILFITIGIINIYHSLELKKNFHKHNLINSILTSLLWIMGGIVYPMIIPQNNLLQAIGTITIFLIPIFVIVILISERLIIKKNPSLIKKRSFSGISEKYDNERKKSGETKQDIRRKLFHLIPPIIIILIRLFTLNWIISKTIILIIGYSGVLLFSLFDFIRHSFIYKKRYNHLIPDRINNLLIKTMKKQELYEQLKVVPLVLGLLPSLFFPFSIFLSTTLIASLSDGAASVAGHLAGRIHFPKKSKKTLIGYFTGAIASLILVIITCLLFDNLPLKNIIILGIVGMVSFLSIDIIDLKIDDNILNPIISGILLGATYLMIQNA